MLPEQTAFHPLFSGEWDTCEALASSDDVFKFFARGAELTELTSLWKHVEDIMQANVITTTPDTPLQQARAACKQHGIGGMPVVDRGGKLVGIISKSDFRRGGAAVRDAMTAAVVAVRLRDAIPAAAALMLQNDLDRLPVVDPAGRCVGIVTRTDMFWTLAIDNDGSDSILQWHSGSM